MHDTQQCFLISPPWVPEMVTLRRLYSNQTNTSIHVARIMIHELYFSPAWMKPCTLKCFSITLNLLFSPTLVSWLSKLFHKKKTMHNYLVCLCVCASFSCTLSNTSLYMSGQFIQDQKNQGFDVSKFE